MKRILVIQLYRIGDLLQTFPVFRGLRAAHPDARIDLLTDSLLREVGGLCPDIDQILCFPRHSLRRLLLKDQNHAQALYLAASVVDRLRAEHYDFVYNLHHDVLGRRLAGAMDMLPRTRGQVVPLSGPGLALGGGVQRFMSAMQERRKHRRNFVDYLLDIAKLPVGNRGRLRIPATAQLKADELLDSRLPGKAPLVVVQLGASRAFKGLTPEWVAAVQKRLPGARYAWIGSSGERPSIDGHLRAGLKGACFAGDTSLPEVCALIKRAALVLSGDTAATHVAALLDTPTVTASFGTVQPFETGPYGDGHLCVFEPPDCAPCHLHEGCAEPVCKTAISPELLARACASKLEATPPPPGVWVSAMGAGGLAWTRVKTPALAGMAT